MPTKSTAYSHAEPPALHPSTRYLQGIDYEEPGRSELIPAVGLDAKTVRIISGPVSLATLAFLGLAIFIAGFFHGRQMSELAAGAVDSATREPAPVAQTTTAPTHESTAAITHVTIRLFKFSPETIEVSIGQTVEWVNNDLTAHTVTSQGAGDLNSGSIDAGASWRHTFAHAGSFQYFCTFHPEMKGTVVVK